MFIKPSAVKSASFHAAIERSADPSPDMKRERIFSVVTLSRRHAADALRMSLRLFFFSILFSSPAYAYIDPGSSLLLLQGLFAAVGAALTYFRKPWQLLAKLFSRKKNNDA